jgi:hypothetical protein
MTTESLATGAGFPSTKTLRPFSTVNPMGQLGNQPSGQTELIEAFLRPGHAHEISALANTHWTAGDGRGPYPSEIIFRNSCVNGFARMGSSFGPAALIAGVVMCASIAA